MGSLVMTQALAQAMLNAFDAQVNTGTGQQLIRFYTGAPGTDDAAVPAGTALQDIHLGNPAFGNATITGVAGSRVCFIQLQADTPQAVTTTGVVGSAAVLDRNGALVVKGDVGLATGNPFVAVDSTTINSAGVALTESASSIRLALNLSL